MAVGDGSLETRLTSKPNLVLDMCDSYLLKANKLDTAPISLYPDVPSILHSLRESRVQVAAASRTDTPDLARKALKLLKVPPMVHAAETFFDRLVI